MKKLNVKSELKKITDDEIATILQDIYYIFTHKTSRNECIRRCFQSNLTCTDSDSLLFKKVFSSFGEGGGDAALLPSF